MDGEVKFLLNEKKKYEIFRIIQIPAKLLQMNNFWVPIRKFLRRTNERDRKEKPF